MLQQTQAGRVVGPFEAFVDRFPTPTSCARASTGEVLVAWAGLGYNRRGVQLHRAATAITERFGGVVPDQLDQLLSLPGIGPYTARAVLAFAFERPAGVVDVNVARVLSRAVAGRALGPGPAQALADGLVPARRSWAWNQSIMELGASVCRSRHPVCGACPLRARCRWHLAGRVDPDPARAASRQGRFEGSDRQGRGRLVDALRRGPVGPGRVAEACGWPDDAERARRVADALVADGLSCRVEGGTLVLP